VDIRAVLLKVRIEMAIVMSKKIKKKEKEKKLLV
jgi:hypothetical protein